MLNLLYNTLMNRKQTHVIGLLLAMLLPLQAVAYFTPEDVLLSKEFFLPPSSRETETRIANQVDRSAERREREQALLMVRQTPETASALDDADLLQSVIGSDETLRAAAPTAQSLGGLDASDLKLLETVRLLQTRENRLVDRVQTNQQTLEYYGSRPEFLHGGAPPLPPTGAGGALAAMTMIGAVLWTMRRAQKAEQITRVGA